MPSAPSNYQRASTKRMTSPSVCEARSLDLVKRLSQICTHFYHRRVFLPHHGNREPFMEKLCSRCVDTDAGFSCKRHSASLAFQGNCRSLISGRDHRPVLYETHTRMRDDGPQFMSGFQLIRIRCTRYLNHGERVFENHTRSLVGARVQIKVQSVLIM